MEQEKISVVDLVNDWSVVMTDNKENFKSITVKDFLRLMKEELEDGIRG